MSNTVIVKFECDVCKCKIRIYQVFLHFVNTEINNILFYSSFFHSDKYIAYRIIILITLFPDKVRKTEVVRKIIFTTVYCFHQRLYFFYSFYLTVFQQAKAEGS